ncbi:MAG: hypothetical protein GTO49_17220 [Anaerolineae bacterium]|nr:hypothetical protein [Anaerolineae bacterium]
MDIYLHEKQSIIDADDHRFQVVAAGRRFGKSFFAAYKLYEQASYTEKVRSDGTVIDLTQEVVYYVSPTFKQGRENLWNVMMDIGNKAGIIKNIRAQEGEIVLHNDRIIRFKGADDPDSLRGVGLSYCVLDEYAFMKPSVWEWIIRPALGRAEGGALFIGTPAGKNHFFDLWFAAENGFDPMTEEPTTEWKAFQFLTKDNPHLTEEEVESMKAGMSTDAIRQELEANFSATSGKVFNLDMFPVVNNTASGDYIICVDPAGFSNVEGKGKAKVILDDHAIAIIKIWSGGWHVERIYHGKWDVRGMALRLIKAWRQHGCPPVGMERGMAKNAICGDDGQSGYLGELMHKYGYFQVQALTHGNQRKEDRIKWSLQGRAEKGHITLQPDTDLPAEEKWVGKFLGQAVDFPNPLAKDDLIDCVAYADQMIQGAGQFDDFTIFDNWVPHDLEVGY